MKKPSIATTIDEETQSPTPAFYRRSRKAIPLSIPHEFIEVHHANWLYKTIGVAYLIQCANNSEEARLLLEKLDAKVISLTKCKNIPKGLKQGSKQFAIIEEIQRALEFTKELLEQGKDTKEQIQELVNFIEGQQKTALAITLLIRSIALHQVEEILNATPLEFLGNQLEIIADYALNPAYKIVSLLSKVFNYSIKISDLRHQELNKQITQIDASRLVTVVKSELRIFFSISIMNQEQLPPQKKNISIPPLPTKVDEPYQPVLSSEVQIEKPKSIERTVPKPKEKSVEGLNTSAYPPTDRVKVCLSCGETRKPEQKFCECKKRKITTAKSIV